MKLCNGAFCQDKKTCRYSLPDAVQKERRAKGERFKAAKRQPCYKAEK